MLHHLYLGYVKFHFHTKKNLQRGQGGLMKINHKLYVPNYPADRSSAESLNVAIATAIVCAEFRRLQH